MTKQNHGDGDSGNGRILRLRIQAIVKREVIVCELTCLSGFNDVLNSCTIRMLLDVLAILGLASIYVLLAADAGEKTQPTLP